MALQVWLPLNGNLDNLGLSNITVTNNGATVNDNGKIGKCYLFGTSSSYLSLPKEAMTSFTTEASICFWLKINTFNTAWATYFQAGTGSTPWSNYIFGFLRNGSASTCCFAIGNGTTSSQTNYLTPSLSTGIWYHVGLIYKPGHCLIYLNGDLHLDFATTYTVDFSKITHITLGKCNNGSSYQTDCLINDVRIYDHALSPKEVKEISKGLILHYKLNDIPQLNLLPEISTTNFTINNYASRTPGTINNEIYEVTGYQSSTSADTSFGIVTKNYLTLSANTDYYLSFYCEGKSDSSIYFGKDVTNNALTRFIGESGSFYRPLEAKTLGTTFSEFVVLKYHTGSETSYKIYVGFDSPNLYGIGSYIKFSNINLTTEDPTLYRLDNSSIIYDSSGYGYNSTSFNGLSLYTLSTPRYTCATHFNGTTGYILIPSNSLIAYNTFTMNLWFKKDLLGTKYYETLLGGPSGFELDTRNNTALTLSLYGAGVRGTLCSSFDFGKWYMITMVRDGTNEYYYVNGELSSTITVKSVPTGNYFIGAWQTSSRQNFYGEMSDFRLYCTSLTAEDILELYNTSAFVDNNGNDYCYQFEELINNIELNVPLKDFNKTSCPSCIEFNGTDLVFIGTSSSYSDYIEVDVSKTLFYDITYSNTSGSWFLIGFERFDENKTVTSNNGCVYIMTTTSEVDHKRITGTVTLSNINGNVCKFTRIRILNCWGPQSTITGGVGKIHSFHFTQINGTGDSEINKQGQFTTGWFIEDELLQSLISKNKYVTANQLIEI